MAKLKSLLAYSWAVAATPIILATFIASTPFAHWLAASTGVRVSPWYSGGEVARTVEHEGYRTVVREQVFDGLLGPRREGFVQIEWLPADKTALPPQIQEAVDVDGDGTADLTAAVDVAANTVVITPHSPRVVGLEHVFQLTRDRAIRVHLRRE